MSDRTVSTLTLVSAEASSPGDEQLLERICKHMREDGLPEAMAALFCEVSPEKLASLKNSNPRVVSRLRQAATAYKRDRLLVIREACSSKGSPDWRAQAFLLQYDPEKPAAEQNETSFEKADDVITPAYLAELQRQRQLALMALEEQTLAGHE